MNPSRFFPALSLFVCQAVAAVAAVIGADPRPNVLFVIVDDLRPELGCYGNPLIKTPHFDRFAASATTFTRAFCQASACAPSRASVMLGQRPDTTRVWSLGEKFREINPQSITMPQHFRKFGYHTVSIGKVFHNHMPDPVSFDEPDLRPPEYATAQLIDRDPESFYYDEGLKAELATVREQRLTKNPNAYAGGWAYRPHLPFVAPQKYWDLYDRNTLPLAPNPHLPENAPPMAMDSGYELKGCYDLEWVKHPALERLPAETARLLKHGYYASVSYVDACFGRLMDGLKEAGLDHNTIVVVWGDHGWKLGEHGAWAKQTNYNIDTRVPLLIRAPGKDFLPAKSHQLVELVDLYPTLCELTGIDIPRDMEGVSLVPLLKTPEVALKPAAFSQYHRQPKVSLDGKRYMGYSMVTPRYHYVQWHTWDNDQHLAGEQVAVELYDNQIDPDENVNIAGRPAHAALLEQLAAQLRASRRGRRPTP